MAQTNQVVSIRPAQLEIGVPGFVPSVTSVPSNVYVSSIQAQSHDERRMTWTWRSPSSSLLMSPLAFGVFKIKVTAPYKISREDMEGTLLGSFDTQDADGGRGVVADQVAVTPRKGYGYRPLFCLGEGNCVQNAAESVSCSVNGAVITELNGNLYSRSLDRCFVPLDVQQRAYSTCGGPCAAYDQVPLSGHVLGLPDTMVVHGAAQGVRQLECLAATAITGVSGYRAIEGRTVDSSVAKRQSNFFDQIIASSGVGAAEHTVTLEIKFPIQIGPFNSLWGASGLSRNDPRLRQALGIANYNQGQLTYNFKNLIKECVRRLGRPARFGAAATLAGSISAQVAQDITVTYDTDYPPETVPNVYSPSQLPKLPY